MAESESCFKAINFDLDTKALQEYYPNKNWREAYDDLRKFMEANGFEHRQGSGYISKNKMDITEVNIIVYNLSSKCSWLGECVNRMDVTNIGYTFDLTDKIKRRCNEIIQKRSNEIIMSDKPDIIEKSSSKGVSAGTKKKLARVTEWAHNVSGIMDGHKQIREQGQEQQKNKSDKGWER